MIVKYENMNRLKEKFFAVTFALLFVIGMIVFNAATSIAGPYNAIHFLATARSYTATMHIDDKAEVVWQSVVDIAKKKDLKIKEENKKKLKFKASAISKNGEELMISLKVRPDSETSSQLIFSATMGGGKPLEKDMKEIVTDILLQFCDEKGLTCKIVE